MKLRGTGGGGSQLRVWLALGKRLCNEKRRTQNE